MNIEFYRTYCLAKPGTSEGMPFDDFASVNLKCDPERAITLREEHDGNIIPGYHMSKRHWNTILTDGSVPDSLMVELIDHSYELVVKSLTKKLKEELAEM